MKSDLTCPVEVVSVRIGHENENTEEKEQLVCVIEFFNLSTKVIDSLQMNIICFNEAGDRLGGRLVRASARGEGRACFSGAFMPDHVEGATRVEASVEKVWFQDGVIWRREERNVREYAPNTLPEGRELDRLRAVAGPDAAGYAREDDIVWMCVCGRANRTSDDKCLRCERGREAVLRDYSFAAIDSTVGRKERQLEKQTMDTLRRSSEETARQMTAEEKKRVKRRRRVRAVIALLVFAAAVLAALRWGVPYGACWYAQRELDAGQAADAKEIFAWVNGYWPGFMGADERVAEAECTIIEGLIGVGSDDTLAQAAQRARELQTAEGDALYERAVIGRAALAIQSGESAKGEELLGLLPQNEEAQNMLRALIYDIASQAREMLDYPTAIDRFESLGDYEDAVQQVHDCTYQYGRHLMRNGEYALACEQFLQVTDEPDAISLIRQCRYAQAEALQDAGEYVEAAALYETLGVYEEAETRGKLCRYTAGMDALEAGDLETAARQLKLAEDYEDAQARFADAAFTLGSSAFEAADYVKAIEWLEELDRQGEAGTVYRSAVYAYAGELEAAGKNEEAAQQYALLGDYEDAQEKRSAILYELAVKEMETSAEAALARFEGLGDYKDAQEKALECRYALARGSFDAGDYQAALDAFTALGKYQDSAAQVRRSRYALAMQLSTQGDHEQAAQLFEECGAYLDAEERAMRAHYDYAAALEEKGESEAAAKAFAALGSYEDAKARTRSNEDAWLGGVYASVKMDMELGDYDSVIDTLEPVRALELPDRYADIPDMYETACLSRAEELIDQNKPLDALPLLRSVETVKKAQTMLDAYVYRIIGRWKDSRGAEYIFREDGSCSIAGEEKYFGGSGYELTVGDGPYPTEGMYQVVNLRKTSLSLKVLETGKNLKLTYVGEATEKAQETKDAPQEPAAAQEDADASAEDVKE